MAAIEGLAEKLNGAREELDAKDARIEDLEAENEQLRERLETETDILRNRLRALETHLDTAHAPADE